MFDFASHEPPPPAVFRGISQTQINHFDFDTDEFEVITIEIIALGILVEEPTIKAKKFIGKARHAAADVRNLRLAAKIWRTH